MLCQKGRLALAEEPSAWIGKAMAAAPIKEAPLTFDVAMATAETRLVHKDPADRFLVATAKVFDLMLVTADQRLLESREVPVMANR